MKNKPKVGGWDHPQGISSNEVFRIVGTQAEKCQELYEKGRRQELDYTIGVFCEETVRCEGFPSMYFMEDGSCWVEKRKY